VTAIDSAWKEPSDADSDAERGALAAAFLALFFAALVALGDKGIRGVLGCELRGYDARCQYSLVLRVAWQRLKSHCFTMFFENAEWSMVNST